MYFDAAVIIICHEVFNFIQIGPVHTVQVLTLLRASKRGIKTSRMKPICEEVLVTRSGSMNGAKGSPLFFSVEHYLHAYNVRGHSQTTLTRFCPLLNPYPSPVSSTT